VSFVVGSCCTSLNRNYGLVAHAKEPASAQVEEISLGLQDVQIPQSQGIIYPIYVRGPVRRKADRKCSVTRFGRYVGDVLNDMSALRPVITLTQQNAIRTSPLISRT
jgi:hypothetical protein